MKSSDLHTLLTAQLAQLPAPTQPTAEYTALLELVSDTYHRQDRELAQREQTLKNIKYQLQSLLTIQQKLLSADEATSILNSICQIATQVISASRIYLWIYKENLFQPFYEMEYDQLLGRFTPVRLQACGLDQAYLDEVNYRQSVVLDDANNSPSLNPHSRLYLSEQKIASLIDVPIATSCGYFGLLRLAQIYPGRHWSDSEQQFAVGLADKINQVAYKYYCQHQKGIDESESRFKSLAQSTDAAIFAFRNFIFFSNSAMEKLTGFGQDAIRVLPVSVLLGENFASQFNSHVLKNTDEGTKRRLEVEFTNRSGDTRWALVSVTATKLENRPTWLATAIDITERKRSEVQLNRQAFHDSLTGLPNRAKLLAEIDRNLVKVGRERHYKFALLFLDLDGFKQINDNFGHLFADEVLIEIGLRLRNLADINHTAARLGGDEFAFLLTDTHSTEQVQQFADKLLQEIHRPILNDDHGVHISASIGICLSDRFGETADLMLRHADVAMYQAKAEGRNRCALFDRKLHAHTQRTLDVEKQLRARLRQGDFQFIFNPVLNTQSGVLAQFDCAINWQLSNPESPAEPAQPNSDATLLMAIEDWSIQKAVQHHTTFNHPCLQLNIALSAHSLTDIHFIRRLGRQLAILPAGAIACSVTESDWMLLHERYQKHLRLMEEIALHWIIEDFGSGHSCLMYLAQLPVKALRLDARFMHTAMQAGGHQPIKALVDMGKNMGLPVIAKGVDTQQHLALARRLHCPLIQGAMV
ncbi:MAG TPA: diguanylate cyclase, partial [Cellvibrionaceae bacterium]|nr:diguanylate cyclase [Cellvibrionaceae bacterium]